MKTTSTAELLAELLRRANRGKVDLDYLPDLAAIGQAIVADLSWQLREGPEWESITGGLSFLEGGSIALIDYRNVLDQKQAEREWDEDARDRDLLCSGLISPPKAAIKKGVP